MALRHSSESWNPVRAKRGVCGAASRTGPVISRRVIAHGALLAAVIAVRAAIIIAPVGPPSGSLSPGGGRGLG